MANFTKSWKMDVGVNHTPAYQVSGRPYATGSIDALRGDGALGEGSKITFPFVTRWIYLVNKDGTNDCRVGFSQNGVLGSDGDDDWDNYFFIVPKDSTSQIFELKVSELWLSGSNNMSVMAGMTSIQSPRVSGSSGPSWSGSVGVG